MIKLKIPKNVMEGAEPFELPIKKTNKAVLLLHGLTGTPSEMQYLGERLHDEGFYVFAPLHPGHGTSIKDLNMTTWQEIYASVEKLYLKIRDNFDDVFVAGLSMGGLLILKLTMDYGNEIKGAASLSTPMKFAGWKPKVFLPIARFTGLKHIYPDLPKLEDDVADKEDVEETHVCYDRVSIKAAISIVKLMKIVKSKLPTITTPLLVMQSNLDTTVEFKSVDIIYDGVSSAIKKKVILTNSLHTITVDVEKDDVAKSVIDFFEARL